MQSTKRKKGTIKRTLVYVLNRMKII